MDEDKFKRNLQVSMVEMTRLSEKIIDDDGGDVRRAYVSLVSVAARIMALQGMPKAMFLDGADIAYQDGQEWAKVAIKQAHESEHNSDNG